MSALDFSTSGRWLPVGGAILSLGCHLFQYRKRHIPTKLYDCYYNCWHTILSQTLTVFTTAKSAFRAMLFMEHLGKLPRISLDTAFLVASILLYGCTSSLWSVHMQWDQTMLGHDSHTAIVQSSTTQNHVQQLPCDHMLKLASV